HGGGTGRLAGAASRLVASRLADRRWPGAGDAPDLSRRRADRTRPAAARWRRGDADDAHRRRRGRIMAGRRPLTDEERAIYEWQLWVPGFGEAGQELLKGATVLITRVGGVGGAVAYQLAAAGVGRLRLAHAGN